MATTDKLVIVFDADFQRMKGALFQLQSKVRETLASIERRFTRFGNQMETVGRKMTSALTLPLGLTGAVGVKMAGDFEQGMNQVTAVSGATGAEFEALRAKAKELGETTQYSASEVASAMGFMAMAGLRPQQILGGITDTLKLAASAQMDLGQAADIVTNILTGFGMDIKELGGAVDELVAAFTGANTNLSQLGDAFKYAGGVAKATGQSFTGTTTALALMGNAGFQAEMAGTALRGALVRLVKPTAEVKRALNAIGLNARTANGGLVDLRMIIAALEPHVNNAQVFMALFGQRAGPGMLGLVRQGLPAFDMLKAKLEESGGLAQKIADVQMKGFNGQMRALKSAVEGLAIAIGDSGLLSFFTNLAAKATELVRWMAHLNPETLRLATVLTGLLAVLGPLAIGFKFVASALLLFLRRIVLIPALITAAVLSLKNLYGALEEWRNKKWYDKVFGEDEGEKAAEGFWDSFWRRTEEDVSAVKLRFEGLFKDAVSPEEERKLKEELARVNSDIKQMLAKTAGTGDVIELPIDIDETDKKIDAAKEKLSKLNVDALKAAGKQREALEIEYNADLAAYQKLLDQKLISTAEFEKARANLLAIKAKSLADLETGQFKRLQDTMQSVSSNIESALSSAFDSGKLDAKAMVTSIIKDLALLQIKAAVLSPLFGTGTTSVSGATGGADSSLGAIGKFFASLFHTGGVVGQGGARRAVPAAVFISAPRFHSGGMPGLRSDEVPAILQRGETVIPKGGSSGGSSIVFNVQASDAESFRRSEGQISAMLSRAVSRGKRFR